MESRLFDASRQQYDSIVRNATASMSNAFATRAKKFDGKASFHLTERKSRPGARHATWRSFTASTKKETPVRYSIASRH